jgi:hypothetical protein
MQLSNYKLKFLLILILLISCTSSHPEELKVTNYAECVAQGNVIMRTIPARCISRLGAIFVDPQSPKISPDGTSALCTNKCGDTVCQQIVCQTKGCPCPETPTNCATDCT